MMSSNAWTKIKHTFNTLNVIVGKKKQPMYFFSKKTEKDYQLVLNILPFFIKHLWKLRKSKTCRDTYIFKVL